MARTEVHHRTRLEVDVAAWSKSLAAVIVLAAAAGCSSDDGANAAGGTGATGGSAGSGGLAGSGGSAGSGGAGATFAGLAQPCENFHTGYPGDEFCIKAPPAGEGTQVHYGPSAYDEASVRPFLIAPGAETVDVQYNESTNEEEILFDRYAGRLRPGSHHLIVSQSEKDVPDVLRTDEDFPPLDFDVLFGSQTGNFNVPEPGEQLAQDEDGLAFSLGARRQLSLNSHFINTTDKPLLREAWFNVWKADPATIRTIAAPIFLVAGVGMSIQPNTTQIIRGEAVAPQNLRAHLLFGHFHSHTVRFTAWAVRGGQRDLVYEAFDYHEPPNLRYNGVVKNPAPDQSTGTPGGSSGILELHQGDKFEWECEIVNNDDFVITFANEVLTGEMCNLFGFYSPTMGGPWNAYVF